MILSKSLEYMILSQGIDYMILCQGINYMILSHNSQVIDIKNMILSKWNNFTIVKENRLFEH